MALGKYRTLFGAQGLGKLQVRQVLPTPDAAFYDAGYLGDGGTELGDVFDSVVIKDESGRVVNQLEQGRMITLATELQQVGKDQMDLLRNSSGLIHAIRYSGLANPGLFQYFCMEQARISPTMTRKFNPQKQTLPFRAIALKQDPTSVDIPEYYVIETVGKIKTDNLVFWLAPYFNYGSTTTKLLDASGFAYHGTQYGSPVWNTVPNRLTFDGVNDYVDFGDVLNIDASSDFVIEIWVRVLAANGTVIRFMGKRATTSDTADGYTLLRAADNTLSLNIGDGVAAGYVNSTTTLLQNVWAHIAWAVDRNGNGQIYINGVAAGNPASVAALGDATTAASFYLGRYVTAYSNFDLGAYRHYNFGAGGLPSDIATTIANHFAAERAIFGV